LHWLNRLPKKIWDEEISPNEREDIIIDIKIFSPISNKPATQGRHKYSALLSLSLRKIDTSKSTYSSGKRESRIKDE